MRPYILFRRCRFSAATTASACMTFVRASLSASLRIPSRASLAICEWLVVEPISGATLVDRWLQVLAHSRRRPAMDPSFSSSSARACWVTFRIPRGCLLESVASPAWTFALKSTLSEPRPFYLIRVASFLSGGLSLDRTVVLAAAFHRALAFCTSLTTLGGAAPKSMSVVVATKTLGAAS